MKSGLIILNCSTGTTNLNDEHCCFVVFYCITVICDKVVCCWMF